MLQAILIEPQKVILRMIDKPEVKKNQVVIKIVKIGICGSDIHAYYGKHPYISCPVIQGHEFSGVIAEVGEGVEDLKVGDSVTVMPQLVCGSCYPCTHGNYHICNSLKVIGCQADGAAQEFLAVDSKLVIKLPEGMSHEYGAMIEPVAVGVHAAGRTGNMKGLKVLVLGAGPIGNLTAQAAKGMGAEAVMVTDISDFRLDIARQCGIDFCVNTAKADLASEIRKSFGDDGADVIFECVGAQATIEQAIRLGRKGTDIIIVGVFGSRPQVDIGLVQDKELRLIGTLMYKEKDYYTAIDLITSGKIALDPLITTSFEFKDYAEAYKFIENEKDRSMKVLINMGN